jgi:tRNA(adenine34) deaminase
MLHSMAVRRDCWRRSPVGPTRLLGGVLERFAPPEPESLTDGAERVLGARPAGLFQVAAGRCDQALESEQVDRLGPRRRSPSLPTAVGASTISPVVPGGPVASNAVDLDAAMGLALDEAATAVLHDDVPIGALVLRDGEVIAQRHNERERSGDPAAHAEVLALHDAAAVVGGWRLEGTTLVVTIEPCPMCAGALVAARVDRVVFGAADPKAGACGSLYNLCVDPRLNHEVEVVPGVRANEATALITGFFDERR